MVARATSQLFYFHLISQTHELLNRNPIQSGLLMEHLVNGSVRLLDQFLAQQDGESYNGPSAIMVKGNGHRMVTMWFEIYRYLFEMFVPWPQ